MNTENNTDIKTYDWDKQFSVQTLNTVLQEKDEKKFLPVKGQDSVYFGRAISSEGKWQRKLQIAGIIIGTCLILPIPILYFTGCYKRCYRLITELNENISIEGKINNFASQIFNKRDEILNGALKNFEGTIEAEILNRMHDEHSNIDKAKGSFNITINNKTTGLINNLNYEFQYDKNQAQPLKLKLIESDLTSTQLFKLNDEKELFNIIFGFNLIVKDQNGTELDNYYYAQKAIHFLPKLYSS